MLPSRVKHTLGLLATARQSLSHASCPAAACGPCSALQNLAEPSSAGSHWAGSQLHLPGLSQQARQICHSAAAHQPAEPGASSTSPGAVQAGEGLNQQISNTPASPIAAQWDAATRRKAAVNRLLYRSKQRGFLEMDLLVGQWAERALPTTSDDLLAAYSQVLDQENPDLFKWLTGQLPAPGQLQANPAFQALQQHVAKQMAEKSQRAARATPGAAWVRGWDDGWQKQQPQPAPTQ